MWLERPLLDKLQEGATSNSVFLPCLFCKVQLRISANKTEVPIYSYQPTDVSVGLWRGGPRAAQSCCLWGFFIVCLYPVCVSTACPQEDLPVSGLKDQQVLGVWGQCQLFQHSVETLRSQLQEKGEGAELVWDKVTPTRVEGRTRLPTCHFKKSRRDD